MFDLKVHHYDSKGKLYKTTPYRRYTKLGEPDLYVKLWTDDNKFVCADDTPYPNPEKMLSDEALKEFAYLLDKDGSKN